MRNINSIAELKNILSPVLKYRIKTLRKNNIILTEEELFRYFVQKKWKLSNNLHLCEIVDDIINFEINDEEEVFSK